MDSIIPMVVLPATEIIVQFLKQHKNALDNMTRAFSIYPNI